MKFYETEICSGFGVMVQWVEIQQKQEEPQVQESDRVVARQRVPEDQGAILSTLYVSNVL